MGGEATTGVVGRELGELTAKVDILLKSVDELGKELRNKYVPREETMRIVSGLESRISTLEQAPQKRTAVVISVIACVAACISSGVTLVVAFR